MGAQHIFFRPFQFALLMNNGDELIQNKNEAFREKKGSKEKTKYETEYNEKCQSRNKKIRAEIKTGRWWQ